MFRLLSWKFKPRNVFGFWIFKLIYPTLLWKGIGYHNWWKFGVTCFVRKLCFSSWYKISEVGSNLAKLWSVISSQKAPVFITMHTEFLRLAKCQSMVIVSFLCGLFRPQSPKLGPFCAAPDYESTIPSEQFSSECAHLRIFTTDSKARTTLVPATQRA